MRIDSMDKNISVNLVKDSNFSKEAVNKPQKETQLETKKTNFNEAEKSSLPISEKVIIEAIERANKAIEGARTEFRFSIHEVTHEISVKVLDKDNGEVIREIPPEKVLDMVAQLWEMAGIIVDERR